MLRMTGMVKWIDLRRWSHVVCCFGRRGCISYQRIKKIGKAAGPTGVVSVMMKAFLTSMVKTVINTNIIPHIWKLANIVPIPKPNKDIDKGTSYRPISLLSTSITPLTSHPLHKHMYVDCGDDG